MELVIPDHLEHSLEHAREGERKGRLAWLSHGSHMAPRGLTVGFGPTSVCKRSPLGVLILNLDLSGGSVLSPCPMSSHFLLTTLSLGRGPTGNAQKRWLNG